MGLVLTGKCYGRPAEGRPYTLDDGRTGKSYKARVGLGGGKYLDVSIPEGLITAVPTKDEAGSDGVDVAWNVVHAFGKIRFESLHSESTRALRATGS